MDLRIAPLRNYNKENNTRKCKCCGKWKDLSQFSSRVKMPYGIKDPVKNILTLYSRETCKSCSLNNIRIEKYSSPKARHEIHSRDPRKIMFRAAKTRAKKRGIPFNITIDDLILPEICPLLNIPMIVGSKVVHDGSPSLDRIDSSKGYIKGNVMIISKKANSAKNNLSLQELQLLVINFERVLYKLGELREKPVVVNPDPSISLND